ncbi:hypothetical protein H6P81_014509 [Aristolochia fimbriata]|uniref:Plastid division protein n=1 Tax=Aristolochia fimbriata TaxID=158543 RepID=A0AAV7EL15_ARIFI|nr:hypothetical protein H6P81_014509 [Aristolochia fimbriata]
MEPVRNLQSLVERAWELHDGISNEIQFGCVGLGELFRPHHRHHDAFAGSSEDPFAAERRSLIAIRDAMRALYIALLSLQKMQSRQKIELEAAGMRLEESKLFLQQRLAEYPGIAPNVLHEMLKFVNQEHNSLGISSGYPIKNDDSLENTNNVHRRHKRCIFWGIFRPCLRVLSSTWRLHNATGVLGKLVVVAASLFSAIHFYRTRDYYFQRKETCMQQMSLSHGRKERPFSNASTLEEFYLLQNFTNNPSDVFFGRG